MSEHQSQCGIVQDLLPLYYDRVCSEDSRQLVERHLSECADCKKVYEELNDDTSSTVIVHVTKGVLARHAKKERNAAYRVGVAIAGILLLPILITAIVSRAIWGGSDRKRP